MNFQSFKNAEEITRSVLATNVESRGNDVELVLSVWEKQGLKLTDDQKKIAKMCYSPESITRARRKIQEVGLYRPSKEIQQKRMFMEDMYRENYRKS